MIPRVKCCKLALKIDVSRHIQYQYTQSGFTVQQVLN